MLFCIVLSRILYTVFGCIGAQSSETQTCVCDLAVSSPDVSRRQLGAPGTVPRAFWARGSHGPRRGCGTERLCDLPGVPQNEVVVRLQPLRRDPLLRLLHNILMTL